MSRLSGVYQCRRCRVNLTCDNDGKIRCVKCGWKLWFPPGQETLSAAPDSTSKVSNTDAREFLNLPASRKP